MWPSKKVKQLDVAFDELDVARTLCRDNYYFFLKEFWNTVVPEPFIDNWHIQWVTRELQYLVEWFLKGLEKDHDPKYDYKPYDLIINLSPGSTKSLLCSVFLQPWVWTCYPQASFIGSSYQENLSIDLSRKSRMVIKSDKYREYFPEVIISEDQDAKGKFANTAQGERNSVGNKGGITGRHADFIIIDDPIDPKGSRSEVEMTLANQFITETLWSRKKNKARTPTILVMQRLHQCLLPGTPVQTSKGRISIEALEVGNRVISKTGVAKVVDTSARWHEGQVVSVRVFGHPDIITMTPDHRIFTKRGWVESGELTQEDWVFGGPKKFQHTPKFHWPKVRYADPPKNPTGNFVEGITHSSLSEEVVRKYAKKGMSNCDIARKLGVHRNTVHNAMLDYKIKRVREINPIFDEAILQDPEFWYVMGLWVAEGTFGRGRNTPVGIRFSLHKKENYFVDRIFRLFWKYGVQTHVREKIDNTMQIYVWSSQVATFIQKYFCYGSHNKRVPLALYALPPFCKQKFIEGWIDGDGSYNRKKKIFRGATVSHHLADGISMLLGTLGVSSWISKDKGVPAFSRLLGYNIVESGKARSVNFCSCDTPWLRVNDTREFSRESQRKVIVDSDGIWRKVKFIQKKDYAGLVYDLQTTDHSFLAGGICVHNCDPTAMMLELAHRGETKIRHLCFPAVLTDDVKPVSCKQYYKDGLFDPIRLPKRVLDEAALQGEYSYAGQFLQRPVPIGGGTFKTDNIILKDRSELPIGNRWVKRVRYWDKAATANAGCFTVGFLMGKDIDQRFWILDVLRGRWDSAKRENLIKSTAMMDGQEIVVGIEQEPGSSGKDSAAMTVGNLAGFRAIVDRPSGSKEDRADPFSTQVNGGNVYMVRGAWNRPLLDEMALFPNSTYKDQIDAGSGAFKLLTLPIRHIGGWRR